MIPASPAALQHIERPLWRAFPESSFPAAVRHVQAGGNAVVWEEVRAAERAWLLLPCEPDGSVRPLSHWTILMFGRRSYGLVRSPDARGLALLRVPRRFEADVEAWCVRDAAWRGATRRIALDCTACGACCHGCRPVLRPGDLQRWRTAGRRDLLTRRYVRRSGGALVLRQRESGGACVHLRGARCDIYPLRPLVCRIFPVGSEGCLEARRLRFGLVDGPPMS